MGWSEDLELGLQIRVYLGDLSRTFFMRGKFSARAALFSGRNVDRKTYCPREISKIRYLDAQNQHLFLDS